MIKIIIDGHENKKKTYTISDDAFIDIYTTRTINMRNNTDVLTNVHIEAMDSNGIEVEEEDLK